MKCSEAEKNILLQDSGEWGSRNEGSLAAHLHDCESCRRFQHALVASQDQFSEMHEPSIKAVQNVLREARLNAPEKKRFLFSGAFKPALAMAAAGIIGMGLFFSFTSPGQVGMELVVSESQLLETEEQIVDLMYSGFSEDDLAFNFLMTFEG